MRALLMVLQALLLALPVLPGPALAQELIEQRAWLEDPGGTLNLAQVRARPQDFTPFDGLLIRGYSGSTFWVRLRVSGVPAGSPLLLLRLQPGYIDEIELHDPLQPGPPPRVGDRQPPPPHGHALLQHGLLLPPHEAPRTLYLRVRSTSTVLLQAELMPLPQALASERRHSLWAGLFIGAMALFLAWALVHVGSGRERLIAVFATHQAVALLYALAYMGYGRTLVGPAWPAPWMDMATSTLILVSASTNFWFHGHFLREFRPRAWTLWLLRGLLLVSLVNLVRLAFGDVRAALQFNMLLVVVGPLAFLLAALSGRVWRDPQGRAAAPMSRVSLLGLYLLLALLVLLLALPALGWQGSSVLTVQGWPIWGFISGLLVVTSLELRTRQQRRNHQAARIELALSRQHVEQERRQRLQQSQFMAMLTHELKTPLAVMSMATRHLAGIPRERAERAIHDMSAVIDRCAQAERLHEAEPAPQQGLIDLAAELHMLRQSLPQADRIALQLSPALRPWQGDVQLLRTVLRNLLDNALKYGDPRAPVHVQAHPQARGDAPGRAGVALRVSNAPGRVGWPDARQVFQKYYRGPGAHSHTGSGLGLYLAREMAHRLGGELRYAPDPDAVRFECWLPT